VQTLPKDMALKTLKG
jgi:hypothetical protein